MAQLYQINPDYLLRKIGGEYAIIPVGEDCLISNAVMTPNDSAVFLWNLFLSPCSEEEAIEQIMENYDGAPEQIKADVRRFLQETLRCGILKEVN